MLPGNGLIDLNQHLRPPDLMCIGAVRKGPAPPGCMTLMKFLPPAQFQQNDEVAIQETNLLILTEGGAFPNHTLSVSINPSQLPVHHVGTSDFRKCPFCCRLRNGSHWFLIILVLAVCVP